MEQLTYSILKGVGELSQNLSRLEPQPADQQYSDAHEKGYTKSYPSGLLSICFILSTTIWYLPWPIAFAGALSCLFLIPAAKALNFYWEQEKPHLSMRKWFSVIETLFILICGAIFVLGFLGSISKPLSALR